MSAKLNGALCGLLACFSLLATATPREEAATREAGSIRFLIAASKDCAAFKARAPSKLMEPEEGKDAGGRVITARNGVGTDFAFEYDSDKRLTAIVTQGKRIPMDASRVTATLDELRAREILYLQARKICSVTAGTPVAGGTTNLVDCDGDECGAGGGGYSGGGFGGFGGFGVGGPGALGGSGLPSSYTAPASWFEAEFWTDTWLYSYMAWGANSPPPPRPIDECLSRCATACDVTSDAINIVCGVAAYYAVALGPQAPIAVGTACLAGSFVGKYYCRFVECPRLCQ